MNVLNAVFLERLWQVMCGKNTTMADCWGASSRQYLLSIDDRLLRFSHNSMTENVSTKMTRTAPPDTGWSWMILWAGSLLGAASIAMNSGFAIVFSDFLMARGVQEAALSSISNFSLAVLSVGVFFSGPLSQILSKRRMSICSAIMMTSGLMITSRVRNVYQFLISYSLLFCFFSGLIYGLSFLVVNDYFDKRRGLAMSVFSAGSAMGRIALPTATAALFSVYSDSGTILILSAIWAHSIPAALVIQPLDWPGNFVRKRGKPEEGTSPHARFEESSENVADDLNTTTTTDVDDSLSTSITISSESSKKCPEEDLKHHVANPQADVSGDGEENCVEVDDKSPWCLKFDVPAVRCSGEACSPTSGQLEKNLEASHPCKSSPEEPPQNVIQRLRSTAKLIACLPIDVLKNVNFRLLRRPMVALIVASECFLWTGLNNFFYVLSLDLMKRGFTMAEIGTVLSIVPAADLVSRLSVPLTVDRHWTEPKHGYVIGFVCASVGSAIFPCFDSKWGIFGSSALVGFGMGSAVSNFALVSVRYCGKENLPSLRSFTGLMPAVCFLASGPVIGPLAQWMGSYSVCFYLIAALTGIPPLLWLVVDPLSSS